MGTDHAGSYTRTFFVFNSNKKKYIDTHIISVIRIYDKKGDKIWQSSHDKK